MRGYWEGSGGPPDKNGGIHGKIIEAAGAELTGLELAEALSEVSSTI